MSLSGVETRSVAISKSNALLENVKNFQETKRDLNDEDDSVVYSVVSSTSEDIKSGWIHPPVHEEEDGHVSIETL